MGVARRRGHGGRPSRTCGVRSAASAATAGVMVTPRSVSAEGVPEWFVPLRACIFARQCVHCQYWQASMLTSMQTRDQPQVRGNEGKQRRGRCTRGQGGEAAAGIPGPAKDHEDGHVPVPARQDRETGTGHGAGAEDMGADREQVRSAALRPPAPRPSRAGGSPTGWLRPAGQDRILRPRQVSPANVRSAPSADRECMGAARAYLSW